MPPSQPFIHGCLRVKGRRGKHAIASNKTDHRFGVNAWSVPGKSDDVFYTNRPCNFRTYQVPFLFRSYCYFYLGVFCVSEWKKYICHSIIMIYDNMENQENNNGQLQIELKEEVAQGHVCQSCHYHSSSSEFIMDFIRVMPECPKPGFNRVLYWHRTRQASAACAWRKCW